MPVGDTLYRLLLKMSLHGSTIYNTMWIRARETNTMPDVWAMCDRITIAFRDEVLPLWRPCVSQDVAFLGTQVMLMTPTGQAQTIMDYQNVLGTYVGAALPSHDAALISFFTMNPGRRSHGRWYISGIPLAEVTQSTMSVGHKAKLDLLVNRLLQFYGRNGIDSQIYGVVFSKKNGMTIMPGPPEFAVYNAMMGQPWTRVLSHSQIYTNRHRLRGKGM